jgi:hypothetical protein
MTVEERQPHKTILEFLKGVPAEEGRDAFCDEECILACFDYFKDKDDDEREEEEARVEEALSDLEEAGLILTNRNWRTGKTEYAHVSFKERIEAEEADYEALKERVHAGAKKHGLWPKWRERDGWRLVNAGNITVARGPMDSLETYLERLVQDAEKPAA